MSFRSFDIDIEVKLRKLDIRMSSHNRGRGGGGRGGGGRTKKPMINNEDPVQVMFGEISGYLDSRHDRRERLVKLSRDITIESKRIIFCLHR